LPSPCIPASEERFGESQGERQGSDPSKAMGRTTNGGTRGRLEVDRKRINAAVWHDFPRVGHEAWRNGLFNLSAASDKAPGLSDSCPCHTREGPCLAFPAAPTEWPRNVRAMISLARQMCNHHRQTGNLVCFFRLGSRPSISPGGEPTDWRPRAKQEPGQSARPSCCDLE
jgi:hypothetical protein